MPNRIARVWSGTEWVNISSITEYEKVTMITVPISSSELFLISTEPRADYLKIIDTVRSEISSSD